MIILIRAIQRLSALSLAVVMTTTLNFRSAIHLAATAIIDYARPAAEETQKKRSLGTFRITCYTPYDDGGKWGYSTATGVKSKHLATCAVDPSVIPLGSTIEINGLTLQAVDIGGGIKGRIIDVFYDGTDEQGQRWLNTFGERHEVYIY